MTDGPAAPGAGLLKLLVEAGLLALFLGALVFVAGWSYAERFFAELGLNLSAMDGLETESIAAYALWVFRDGWLAVLLFALAALVVGGLVLARSRSGGVVAIALIAVAAILGAGWLGAARASRQVPQLLADDYHAFARVAVTAEAGTTLERVLARLGEPDAGCLRKLFMDRRHLYAYPGYESLRGQTPEVYILPLREIAAIRIVPNLDLCEP